jgi:hypothetical protein
LIYFYILSLYLRFRRGMLSSGRNEPRQLTFNIPALHASPPFRAEAINKQDHRKEQARVKLLLLGAGESGEFSFILSRTPSRYYDGSRPTPQRFRRAHAGARGHVFSPPDRRATRLSSPWRIKCFND